MDEFEILEKKDFKRKLWVTTINSTLLYVLAYLLTYMIYQILMTNRALNFNIDSRLFYYKIKWLDAGLRESLWTQYSIKHIFSIGPFFSLVVGLVFVGIYWYYKQKKGLAKLFCIWTILHSLNMFFGSVIIGLLTTINYNYTNQILKTISDNVFFTRKTAYSSQGLGYISDWLYFSTRTKIILFFSSIILSMVLGFFSTKFFLKSANSAILIKSRVNRQSAIFFQVYLPWVIGTIFLYLIRVPNNTRYEVYFYLTMLIMISPIILNVLRNPQSFKELMIIKETNRIEISKRLLITTLILFLLFRIVLSFGIFIKIPFF